MTIIDNNYNGGEETEPSIDSILKTYYLLYR